MLQRITRRLLKLTPWERKDKVYVEMFNYANGKAVGSLGGYARLTRHYNMRKVRDQPRDCQMDNT